jgi:hypothetical protein
MVPGRKGEGREREKDKKDPRERWRFLLAVVGAVAAAMTAVVAVAAYLDSREGDPNDDVHARVVNEPKVDDTWVVSLAQVAGEEPPPPGSCTEAQIEARADWFRERAGVPGAFENFEVEVVNDSDRTLVLEGLRLDDLEALPAVSGVPETLCPGEGGPFDRQYASVDLDGSPQQFEFFNANFEPVEAIEFSPEPHRPLRFFIQALAETGHYRWYIVLEYSLDGEEHELRLTDAGQPFEVTGCDLVHEVCGPASD